MADYNMTRPAWMRNLERFQEAARGHWTWPLLDLEGYDRRASLNEEEQHALQALAGIFEGGNAREAYDLVRSATLKPTPLTRLVVPLCDVLDVAGAITMNRHMTLRLLLLEVCRRQKVYWGWTCSDWIDILRPDIEQFWKVHHVPRACRRQVIAAGYLLSDCTDLCLLPIDINHLSATIFGKVSVENAIRWVEDGLNQQDASLLPLFRPAARGEASVGRSEKRHSVGRLKRQGMPLRDRHISPRLLCQALLTGHSPFPQNLSYDSLHSLCQKDLSEEWRYALVQLSALLGQCGAIERILPFGIHVEWLRWCQCWYATTSIEQRAEYCLFLLRVGCWLAQHYPDIHSPTQWTETLTHAFLREVDGLNPTWELSTHPGTGEGSSSSEEQQYAKGTKIRRLTILRTFFRDIRQWGWCQVEFDPGLPPWSIRFCHGEQAGVSIKTRQARGAITAPAPLHPGQSR